MLTQRLLGIEIDDDLKCCPQKARLKCTGGSRLPGGRERDSMPDSRISKLGCEDINA